MATTANTGPPARRVNLYGQRRRAFGRHEYRSAHVAAGAQRRHLAGHQPNGDGQPDARAPDRSSTRISTSAPAAATIDTGSNWFTTVTPDHRHVGTTSTKIGTGTWYVRYGLGGSGFNGNVNIQAGTIFDDYDNAGQLTGGNYRRLRQLDRRHGRRRRHLGRFLGQRRGSWAESPGPARSSAAVNGGFDF